MVQAGNISRDSNKVKIIRTYDDTVIVDRKNPARRVKTGIKNKLTMACFPDTVTDLASQFIRLARKESIFRTSTPDYLGDIIFVKNLHARKDTEHWDTTGDISYRNDAVKKYKEVIKECKQKEEEGNLTDDYRAQYGKALTGIAQLILMDIYRNISPDELSSIYGYSSKDENGNITERSYRKALEEAETAGIEYCRKARELATQEGVGIYSMDIHGLGNSILTESKLHVLRRQKDANGHLIKGDPARGIYGDTDDDIRALLHLWIDNYKLDSVKQLKTQSGFVDITLNKVLDNKGGLTIKYGNKENYILGKYQFLNEEEPIWIAKIGILFLQAQAELEDAKLDLSTQDPAVLEGTPAHGNVPKKEGTLDKVDRILGIFDRIQEIGKQDVREPKLCKAASDDYTIKTNQYLYYDAYETKADVLSMIGNMTGNSDRLSEAYEIYSELDEQKNNLNGRKYYKYHLAPDGVCYYFDDIQARAIDGRVNLEDQFGLGDISLPDAVMRYVAPRSPSDIYHANILAPFPGTQFYDLKMELDEGLWLVNRNGAGDVYLSDALASDDPNDQVNKDGNKKVQIEITGADGKKVKVNGVKVRDAVMAKYRFNDVIVNAKNLKTSEQDRGIQYLTNKAYFGYALADSALIESFERPSQIKKQIGIAKQEFEDVIIRLAQDGKEPDPNLSEDDRRKIVDSFYGQLINNKNRLYKDMDYSFYIDVFYQYADVYGQQLKLEFEKGKSKNLNFKVPQEKLDFLKGLYDKVLALSQHPMSKAGYNKVIRPLEIQLKLIEIHLDFEVNTDEVASSEGGVKDFLKDMETKITTIDGLQLVVNGQPYNLKKIYEEMKAGRLPSDKYTVEINGVRVMKIALQSLYFRSCSDETRLIADQIFYLNNVKDDVVKNFPQIRKDYYLKKGPDGKDPLFSRVISKGKESLQDKSNMYWNVSNVVGAGAVCYPNDKDMVSKTMDAFLIDSIKATKDLTKVSPNALPEKKEKKISKEEILDLLSFQYFWKGNFKRWLYDDRSDENNTSKLKAALVEYKNALKPDGTTNYPTNLSARLAKADVELTIANVTYKVAMKHSLPDKYDDILKRLINGDDLSVGEGRVKGYKEIVSDLHDIAVDKVDLQIPNIKEEQRRNRETAYKASKANAYLKMTSIVTTLIDLAEPGKVRIKGLNDRIMTADGYYLEQGVAVGDVINKERLYRINTAREKLDDSKGNRIFSEENSHLVTESAPGATISITDVDDVLSKMDTSASSSTELFGIADKNFKEAVKISKALKKGESGGNAGAQTGNTANDEDEVLIKEEDLKHERVDLPSIFEDYSREICLTYLMNPTAANKEKVDALVKIAEEQDNKKVKLAVYKWVAKVTGWLAMADNDMDKLKKAMDYYDKVYSSPKDHLDNEGLKDRAELLVVIYYKDRTGENLRKAMKALGDVVTKDDTTIGSIAALKLCSLIYNVAGNPEDPGDVQKRYQMVYDYALAALRKSDGAHEAKTLEPGDASQITSFYINKAMEVDRNGKLKYGIAGDKFSMMALSYMVMAEGWLYTLEDAKDRVGDMKPPIDKSTAARYGIIIKSGLQGPFKFGTNYIDIRSKLNGVYTLVNASRFSDDTDFVNIINPLSSNGIGAVTSWVRRSYGVTEGVQASALMKMGYNEKEYFYEEP